MKPVQVRMPWTDDEIEILRRSRNLTVKQLAESLGRSYSSVASMRTELAKDEGLDFTGGRDLNPNYVGSRRLLARTCLGCGLLLESKWYTSATHTDASLTRRTGSRTWTSRCSTCRAAQPSQKKSLERYRRVHAEAIRIKSSATKSQLNAISRQLASRNGFPWIDEDHVILRNSSLSAFEKAIKLGRTVAAVHTQCGRNGYTSRVGKGDPVHGVWHIENPNETAIGAIA